MYWRFWSATYKHSNMSAGSLAFEHVDFMFARYLATAKQRSGYSIVEHVTDLVNEADACGVGHDFEGPQPVGLFIDAVY